MNPKTSLFDFYFFGKFNVELHRIGKRNSLISVINRWCKPIGAIFFKSILEKSFIVCEKNRLSHRGVPLVSITLIEEYLVLYTRRNFYGGGYLFLYCFLGIQPWNEENSCDRKNNEERDQKPPFRRRDGIAQVDKNDKYKDASPKHTQG